MAWFILFIAGLLEVVWASSLKSTAGFSRLWPSAFTIAAMIGSFILLSRAMISLPTGVAYAVWVGIGAIGASFVSVWFMGERLSVGQWGCIGLIALGVIGLKLVSDSGIPGAAPADSTAALSGPETA